MLEHKRYVFQPERRMYWPPIEVCALDLNTDITTTGVIMSHKNLNMISCSVDDALGARDDKDYPSEIRQPI